MVSFQCESCGDVLTKKKLDPHRGRCRGCTFSCIDCMVHFYGTEYRAHTSCMTEDQKYQGALYKDNNKNNKNNNKKARINPPNGADEEHHFHPSTPAAPPASTNNHNSNNNNSNSNNNNNTATKNNKQQVASTPSVKKSNNMAAVAQYQQSHHMSHAAYVEDVPEELEAYLVADDDDHRSDDDAPPHAPTPPPAAEGPVNVFDFLVAGATPNASSLGLSQPTVKFQDNNDASRYEYDANAYLAATTDDFSMAGHAKYQQHLAQYGPTGPVPTPAEPMSTALTPFKTPAPDRAERKKKESSSDKDKDASKKDKKRKRLYLDINDQVMTDAPPVLHSGLTGGLHRLTTKHADFPPSPESAETPASPLKKSKAKHSKTRTEPVTNSLFSMLTAGGSKSKSKKRKHRRSVSPSGKKHSSSSSKSHRKHRSADKDGEPKAAPQKLLEYPGAEKKDGDNNDGSGQLIVYKPRADLFLSFVNKGPDSERGCSMNKALKRFHRERSSSGTSLAKPAEEKELFRSLRLRKNDRGEIVLFCVDDDE